MRGRRSTWSTFIEVGGSPATSDANGRRLVLRGRRSTWSTILEARFAWHAQHLEHFIQAPFAWQAQHLEYLQRGRRKSGDGWCERAPPRFCVAGAAPVAWQAQHLAALGALQAPFAWQAQHLGHVRLVLRGRSSTWSTFLEVGGSPATSDMQIANGSCLVLRGRRSTWNTSSSFCVAGAALGAPCAQHLLHYIIRHTIYTTPSPQHHQHNLTNTTSSTHYHLHNTIYTTPSTQHHLHYILSSNIGRCSNLTPSASFLLIPLFVFLRCGLFFVFVLLTYSTVGCPKTLLTCGVIRSYFFFKCCYVDIYGAFKSGESTCS